MHCTQGFNCFALSKINYILNTSGFFFFSFESVKKIALQMIQSLSNFKNYILQEINAKYELCSLCEEEGKDKKTHNPAHVVCLV